MKKLYFLIHQIIILNAFTQPDPLHHFEDTIWGTELMWNKRGKLTSLMKFSADLNFHFHVTSGNTDFKISNLGKLNATFVLITVDHSGHQKRQLLSLGIGEQLKFSVAKRESAKEFHIFSLQNFSVTSIGDKPLGNMATPPWQKPAILPVRTPSGALITVGVTRDTQIHYPTIGRRIGRLSDPPTTVIQDNGTVLHLEKEALIALFN